MKLYYEETYGRIYETDETIPSVAEEKLIHDISEGKENPPEECMGSRCVPLYGGDGGFEYQLMDDYIDRLSDNEKLFFLWQLVKWYPQILDTDKVNEDHPAILKQIDRLKSACEEMEELICYKLF